MIRQVEEDGKTEELSEFSSSEVEEDTSGSGEDDSEDDSESSDDDDSAGSDSDSSGSESENEAAPTQAQQQNGVKVSLVRRRCVVSGIEFRWALLRVNSTYFLFERARIFWRFC